MVNALIQNGANINLVDGDEQTALHVAAANGKRNFLLREIPRIAFNFLIIMFINSGNDKVVSSLLRYGANVSSVDNYGWTALMIASENGIPFICIAF